MSRQVVPPTGEITPEAECEWPLVERLREESLQLARRSFDSVDAGISANLCDSAIDEIERLRAQLAAAEAEKAEIRRVFNAEIDCLARASQKEIESWQNERNHARQDCDEARAKLATATKALEVVRDEVNRVVMAVEALACHQEQCDMDGVMVKVSRQAVEELISTIETINTITARSLTNGAKMEQSSSQ